MCGPADYHALQTCILRLTALSIAGLATYVIHRMVQFCKALRNGIRARSDARTAL